MSSWDTIAERWRQAPGVAPVASGLDPTETAKSFLHCANWGAREGKPILACLRPIGSPRRESLIALLAWYRAARDLIDANWPVEARLQNLARLRDQTERALDANAPRHADPLWPAFSAAVCSYAIDPAWVLSALDEMGRDLETRTHTTTADLKESAVAGWGSLAIVVLAIAGLAPQADAHEAARTARRWGASMRVVGVLRNFARDFDSVPRRVHLPSESFEEFGLTAFKLRAWTDTDACAAFVARWTQNAQSSLVNGQELASMMLPDSGRAVLSLTELGAGVLTELQRDPSRIVRGGRINAPSSWASRVVVRAKLGRRHGSGRAGAAR